MKKILEIANKLDLNEEIELYGNYKAKINYNPENKKRNGKLILVTSTNPTPYGEGKTTLSIGLSDSLNRIGKKSIVVLREPSLGPVFGSKGGACGGGLAKVEPELDINLHFNGDFHAITSANNLLCSIIDNHIYEGNSLNIDEVVFNRCIDINDRALRNINLNNRIEHFDITPASEIMAIICLSRNIYDLKERLGNIIVGYTKEKNEVYAKDLKCVDALTILLKDAIKPNLVGTLYGNPAIIHGGPFANIAHGCNSVIGTLTALKLSDYVITEAGFGSDMGALKFFDIKCRLNNIYPDVVIINTTIKSLKYNGNDNLEKGIENLKFHIENMKRFNDNVIVSLNKFDSDLDIEIEYLKDYVENLNTKFVISTMYKDGEDGCIDLANLVLELENKKEYYMYDLNESLKEKIEKVCKHLGCSEIIYEEKALEKINNINKDYPICIAKTPFSITDDKNILGYPKDFKMKVTDIKVLNGAGFIVVYMGNILTMPGLSRDANYLNMHIN
ncbi:MAG: formate--tetrahydrofolate ligase [Lactobacillales bacterium]|nr:formate--tetrahydrofolate ligase [Lactobacillales bacterium]